MIINSISSTVILLPSTCDHVQHDLAWPCRSALLFSQCIADKLVISSLDRCVAYLIDSCSATYPNIYIGFCPNVLHWSRYNLREKKKKKTLLYLLS